jgi:hypothetical protein
MPTALLTGFGGLVGREEVALLDALGWDSRISRGGS